MTPEEEIKEIIKNRYSNYKPLALRNLGVMHSHIRAGIGDVSFLEFLKKLENENPVPVYVASKEVVELLENQNSRQ